MSQCASCGRVTPRASSAGQPLSLPASIAGLVGRRALVRTEPPFAASGDRPGSLAVMSPGFPNAQLGPARLLPFEVIAPTPPAQSAPPLLPAMIVLVADDGKLDVARMPGAVPAVLPEKVELSRTASASVRIPPPEPPAWLSAAVTFVSSIPKPLFQIPP